MLVDGGEGEEEGAVEDGGEVGDAVEDGNEKGEAGDEADDELGEDGFRDVFAGSGGGSVCCFEDGEVGEFYWGISSARWVTTSGVPTE